MQKTLLTIVAQLICCMIFSQTTYTFTGNGNWTIATNWSNNTIPPATLPAGSVISISPAPSDTCVLNTAQTIAAGASLSIAANAKFIINGGVNINAALASITTNTIMAITSTTATSGGNITANGGSPVMVSGIVWGINTAPSVALTTKTNNGLATGSYSNIITVLLPSTKYYVRAYATNGIGTSYGNELSFTTTVSSSISSVTIGTQVWTKKNLDVTTYRNGDPIPQVTDSSQWVNLTTGAWCYYNNDPANGAIYGKLYNWYAVNDPRGLAPEGWHIGSDDDWDHLENILGNAPAGKMKDTVLWYAPNTGATNSSGFSGLPGGYRDENGSFTITDNNVTYNYTGYIGYWWTSTAGNNNNNNYVLYRELNYIGDYVHSDYFKKLAGLSVRCVRNEIPSVFVTTSRVRDITQISANLGGLITNTTSNAVLVNGIVWSKNNNPTIDLPTKTSNGNPFNFFSNDISGLLPSTTYYGRAYATTSAGTSYGNEVSFKTLDIINNDSIFTDPRDYKLYSYKKIGNQYWMTQNLNYDTVGALCYNNNSQTCKSYGRLYNWNTALTVAPPGWHLPSDAEWTELINTLGGPLVAGGKMKSVSSWYLLGGTNDATNSSGFTGLPGGFSSFNNQSVITFNDISTDGYWWSSTEELFYQGAKTINLKILFKAVFSGYRPKSYGLSVRCIRNN